MAKLTPQQAREKWQRNLSAAVQDITNGVNAVTEAPGVKAAAKSAKMLANLTASVQDGTWAKRVAAVPLDEWKRQMLEKGIPRIAQGAQGASAKTERFFAELFAYQDNLKSQVDRMPDLTLEDSIGRMTAWVRGMAKFSKT